VHTSSSAADSEREARRLVCEAYATISYAAGEQINESPVCLGPIGSSDAVIGRAEAVNAAKDELRERCKKIQNVRANVWFNGLDARNRGRVQVSAELPLPIRTSPRTRSLSTPRVRQPGPTRPDVPVLIEATLRTLR